MPKTWQPLEKGDCIQLIAPASRVPDYQQNLPKVINFLEGWGLQVRVSNNIFQEDKQFPNLASNDENRFQDLKAALLDPAVKAICNIRGGYGAIRLIKDLQQMLPPQGQNAKLFMGFSDITLLLMYLRERWNWNVIHGPSPLQAVMGKVAAEDIEQLRQLIFGEITAITINDLKPMNYAAETDHAIESEMLGGNLTLVSRTLGWFPLMTKNKILFFEDVNEPFRKIDGILQQMQLAGYFSAENKPHAVILGDFTTTETNEQLQVNNALQEFADKLSKIKVPVLHCLGIGHQQQNHPIPVGPKARLIIGKKPSLCIESGAISINLPA